MSEYANPAALVDTDWVAANLGAEGIRLVEVNVDTMAYPDAHIPGAVGWTWDSQLQRNTIRDIPTQQEWEELLSNSGISNDTRVILYGDSHNWFAAFAYWLFKMYGHENVQLMDGGRAKWIAEGRETTTEEPSHARATYKAKAPDTSLRALRDDVAATVSAPGNVALIDVRSPAEFSGELLAPANMPQEGAQRGGHVPGAANVPWATAVNEDSTFKSAADLKQIYGDKGVDGTKPAIAYCRIGERSAHTGFVLKELLGVQDVRNYDGSWTEWGSLIGAPIER